MKVILRILAFLVVLIILTLGVFYLISGGQSLILSNVKIKRSQEIIFDYISDMRNELKWNPDVLFMEKISEGPVGLGTRFRANGI